MSIILFIQNGQDDKRFIIEALEAEGHQVFEANDELQGFEIAQTHHPDLILLEMDSPGLSGTEIMPRLRQDPHDRSFSVPVIALLASLEPGAALAAFMAGCDFYLVKPVALHDLRTLVARALEWHRRLGRLGIC
jgi:two-component system cell cycle response regulator DivK